MTRHVAPNSTKHIRYLKLESARSRPGPCWGWLVMLQCKQGQMRKALFRSRTSKSFSSRRRMKHYFLVFFFCLGCGCGCWWLVGGLVLLLLLLLVAAVAVVILFFCFCCCCCGCYYCCSCCCPSQFSDCIPFSPVQFLWGSDSLIDPSRSGCRVFRYLAGLAGLFRYSTEVLKQVSIECEYLLNQDFTRRVGRRNL